MKNKENFPPPRGGRARVDVKKWDFSHLQGARGDFPALEEGFTRLGIVYSGLSLNLGDREGVKVYAK